MVDLFPSLACVTVHLTHLLSGSEFGRHGGCSAYKGEGLLEGFDWLVQDIPSRIYGLD
jgi:ADP-ribosylation factor-like protein 2